MPKARNAKADEARALYEEGLKLVEIAGRLGVPEGTVRRWKSSYQWGTERSDKEANVRYTEANVRNKGGAPRGNKNAAGHGAPIGSQNAKKHGLFSRYMPKETLDIIDALGDQSPLDLLWDQIQIAYAAILRAQQISFVANKDDTTTDKTRESNGDSGYTDEWMHQHAWDKQAAFMQAQARAQSELRSMLKQYDEMLHKDWDMATEEQKARLQLLRSKMEDGGSDGASVVIINDTARREADQ